MATEIFQKVASDGSVILRVDGEMTLDDALLLEKIVNDLFEKADNIIIVDVADLDFLDSESAGILRRISEKENCRIEGIEIFVQNAIDTAERKSERQA